MLCPRLLSLIVLRQVERCGKTAIVINCHLFGITKKCIEACQCVLFSNSLCDTVLVRNLDTVKNRIVGNLCLRGVPVRLVGIGQSVASPQFETNTEEAKNQITIRFRDILNLVPFAPDSFLLPTIGCWYLCVDRSVGRAGLANELQRSR